VPFHHSRSGISSRVHHPGSLLHSSIASSLSYNNIGPNVADTGIRVGTFRLNGMIKHYAVVPPLKLQSSSDMSELLKFWGLAHPNFMIEMNMASKHRENIITMENAPFVLEDIFQPSKTGVTTSDSKGRVAAHGISSTDAIDPTETETSLPSHGPGSLDWLRSQVSWLMHMKHKNDETTGCGMPNLDFSNEDWKWINRYLLRKTIYALSSIASAADMTNGWILCHGPPLRGH